MPNPMMMSNRFLSVFFPVVLGFVTVTEGRAQEPAPQPSPAASPSSTEPSPSDKDRLSDDEAIAIEAAVEAAQVAATRAAETVAREMSAQRWKIERETERLAKAMTVSSINAARLATEARVMAERAARGSMTGHEFAEHESEAREASLEAREAAREEAREAAGEGAQEAAEKAKEKAQAQAERDRERREAARERERERAEQAREKQQEARERARELAEDRRERERERREAASEKHGHTTNVDELYDMAMSAIDEEDWSDALRPLSQLVSLNARVEAALYWTAYSQGKMNRTALALTSLARLQKDFPTSRWAKEGKALELEVRGKSGQAPRPEQEDDLDLKLMAVSALAQSDPQEAMPLLAKILSSPTSPRKIRERSLFVLAQMGSDQASAAIAEVARGNSSPELQRKAIQYLGVFGGPGNRKVLSDVYATTNDNTLRKQILNSFMVSGDKARVLNAAKTEKDPALRADAVRLLGVMGGTAELSQMYSTAASADEKKSILHALFIGGAVEPVAAAARTEKDKDVRLTAVRNLGLMGRKSQDVLGEMYRSETDPEVKKEILNAFFLQNNATRLVEIARAEKDPGLKKEAVHWLSLMNSKESRAYMIELLKD